MPYGGIPRVSGMNSGFPDRWQSAQNDAKALASPSRLASLRVLSTSMLLPPAIWTRGMRAKSFLTQSGG
jgi:hypothetical protein